MNFLKGLFLFRPISKIKNEINKASKYLKFETSKHINKAEKSLDKLVHILQKSEK
jgi:hypothetical protein